MKSPATKDPAFLPPAAAKNKSKKKEKKKNYGQRIILHVVGEMNKKSAYVIQNIQKRGKGETAYRVS